MGKDDPSKDFINIIYVYNEPRPVYYNISKLFNKNKRIKFNKFKKRKGKSIITITIISIREDLIPE